jgi:hypothetical protein
MNLLDRIPISSAKIIIAFFYLILAFWVMRRPRSFVLEGAPTRRNWRDLRIWALVLIGIQIALYFIF